MRILNERVHAVTWWQCDSIYTELHSKTCKNSKLKGATVGFKVHNIWLNIILIYSVL